MKTLLAWIAIGLIQSAYASDVPSDWQQWVQENEQGLNQKYAHAIASDVLRLKPKMDAYVTADGHGSYIFSETKPDKAAGKVQWDGDKDLTVFIPGVSQKARIKKQSDYPLEFEVYNFGLDLGVDGFKRATDKHLTIFLYDMNRPDLKSLRKFSHFNYDSAYKVKAFVFLSDKPKDVTIPTTKGEPKTFKKMGILAFKVGGEPQTLTLYAMDPSDQTSMLMFKDPSNGDKTYSGGRFVDVKFEKPIKDYLTGESVMIDFNFTFNPMCARSHGFMCPVPQDTLNAPILAGEKFNVR